MISEEYERKQEKHKTGGQDVWLQKAPASRRKK